ncbi:MAG: hypothetical protein ACR2RB_11795 [Gammaproteobacteria bacterium]
MYALHDEPATLADALSLDGDYLEFLEQAKAHGHRRVRVVARAIGASIDEDVTTGRLARSAQCLVERRLAASQAVTDSDGGRYFALTARARASLNKRDETGNDAQADRVRNSKSVGCSSNKKSTTTTSNVLSDDRSTLVFPARLNKAHRSLAMKHLAAIAPNQRQALLDELEGRLQAERFGAKPVWDVLRYLARLCESAKSGEFEANLGVAIADQRARLRCAVEASQQYASPERKVRSPVAEESLRQLRALVRRSVKKQP